MSGLIRRLRRGSRKAAKYRFTATPQELVVQSDEHTHPETLAISFMHRRRKVSSRERAWEPSFSNPAQSVMVWPELASERIDILTTLYRDGEGEFEDKEWTVVVEECLPSKTGKGTSGRRRPLAAVPLNLRLLLVERPGEANQLKLKLRPLSPRCKQCHLVLLLASVLESVSDAGSSASSVVSRGAMQDVANINELEEETEDKVAARFEMHRISDSIRQWGEEGRESGKEETDRAVAPPPHAHPHRVDKENGVSPAPSSGVRPPWRVSSTPTSEMSRDTKESRESDPVTSQLDKIPTEMFFEKDVRPEVPKHSTETEKEQQVEQREEQDKPSVDENSLPVPVPRSLATTRGASPRIGRSASPRAPDRRAPLGVMEGEGLLQWAQRATKDYPGVKLQDFGKSFRSGLALLAIMHAYRPELAGDYSSLDFADTMDARRRNVAKALAACGALGIRDLPDADDIVTPDSKMIRLLCERMRRVLEGRTELPTPTAGSDHRISRMYNINESEAQVIDEINRIRERREEQAADALHKEDEQADMASTSYAGRPIVGGTTVLLEVNSPAPSGTLDKREERRRKARQMLDNPQAAVAEGTAGDREDDSTRAERRRQEARRLLGHAATAGSSTNLTRQGSVRSRTSQQSMTGSQTDLRRIELVQPSVQFHAFRRRDPSPQMTRKTYESESPMIPAMGRPTQTMQQRLKQPTGPAQIGSAPTSAFDRVRRFGSMRSQELKDSIAYFAKYGLAEPGPGSTVGGSQSSLNQADGGAATATPTRKVTSQWEKDVADVEGTRREQAEIAAKLDQVTKDVAAMSERMRSAEIEQGSEEEEAMMDALLQLTNDKNALVGQQEYYNIIENIRETSARIAEKTERLDEMTRMGDDYFKSPAEKEETNRLMDEYLQLIGRKDELIQRLFATEEQLREEGEDLKRRTLDRHFRRGADEPLSASKRIITWLKG